MSSALKCLIKSNRIKQTSIQALRRYASTFKAAVLNKPDGLLSIEEIKRSKIGKEEVRIQVSYCSVNTADVSAFKDKAVSNTFIPGYELTGEVLEVGKNVPEELQIGSRVAALTLGKFGGLAEECVVHYNDVWEVPPSLTLKDAAVITFGHALAFYTFAKLSTVKENDKIVVSTGPAGLGLAGVDVAANIYKAKVIAVTDTEVTSELTRNKGAFQTIHLDDNLRSKVLKHLNEGADIVYDAVGGDMHKEIASCVKYDGKIFYASPKMPKEIVPPPPHSSLTIVNFNQLKEHDIESYRQIIDDTLEMAEDGIITSYISGSYTLQDVNQAIEFIKSRKCTGKVVVQLDQ